MSTKRNDIKEIFKASLLNTIAHRRARRFPLGCTIPDQELHYVSEKPPVPLNDLELAMLCWAGNGVTGTITGDLPISGGNLFTSWLGRAAPYACNVHNTRLFYTGDPGTYIYHPETATRTVEVESEDDWETILAAYHQGCQKVLDERAEFVPKSLLRAMHWNTNQPGTTIFIPVVDLTMEYIDLLLGIFDFEGHGYQLFDDRQGKWAGLGDLIDADKLKGPRVDLSSFEQNLLTLSLAPAYMMLENIHLLAEAMGLGSVVFGGYTGTVMLGVTSQSKGLGFRAATDKAGKTNAVGLDGVFEAFCPPYYRDMDEAVEAFVEMKFGSGGLFSADYRGKVAFKNWGEIQPKYHHPSRQSINQVKAVCRHVYETYGRFPASYDTKMIPIWLQVHHLELDFYKAHYPPEMVTEAQRQHMALWHQEEQ
ncbi:MAG: hypothetical protein WC369_00420 [Dehalococcoidales bacterium]|jgi:hypothetical protein